MPCGVCTLLCGASQDAITIMLLICAGAAARRLSTPHSWRGAIVSMLLPLFPLDLVLLPGVPLPLHIFEPRYKEMIKECLEKKSQFGIVRAKEEAFVNTGCTAEVMNVLKTYPDGRMNILVEGQKGLRFCRSSRNEPFSMRESSCRTVTANLPPPKTQKKATLSNAR